MYYLLLEVQNAKAVGGCMVIVFVSLLSKLENGTGSRGSKGKLIFEWKIIF